MLVSTYAAFVQSSDQSIDQSHEARLDIATYGLTAEIGSVVSAVKKRLLAEDGIEVWNVANAEIVEELGDLMWYCFSLAAIGNEKKKPVNIFTHDIANLKREIGATDQRADDIRRALDTEKREAFLAAAEAFPTRTKAMEFEDYQRLAFLTARTKDRTLVEVCLAVLLQLGAQLFRRKLPQIELDLNKALVDRELNDVLGEIAWHVSALASIYQLALSEVAQRNVEKVSYRLDDTHPTPLHDEDFIESQQFPRQFSISFITIAKGRSRMYLNGAKLGDDLTDNSYHDDGYRFHDIMHLANVAKLGWSPVLRGLMGLKRKRLPLIDEVEDGARARIVEEAVIKAIHSEGLRIARMQGPPPQGKPQRLFCSKADISFRFLKFIRDFVVDLEVHKNRYWEWDAAILSGYDIFHRLQCEGQGTISVDLRSRSINFTPEVCLGLDGKVAGLGSAYLKSASTVPAGNSPGTASSSEMGLDALQSTRARIQVMAILDSLGLREPPSPEPAPLTVVEVPGQGISVKASGAAQSAMWRRHIVAFRTSIAEIEGGLMCTAIAISDD
jgi:NTP pyrophosphatase (non-canonical NTP hydrolase)